MSYDSCQTCGDCHTSLILNKDGRCRACIAEEKIVRLENQLASGVHTCTDTCQRPLCVLQRQMKELEDLQLTIYNAGYEKGNFDAVEGHYAPPIEYPEEFPEILEELEGE